ncbi:MAG: acetyl-CoA carboxylase biotin carboxyl carrier protein subunit [Eubacterium sp.]|nr:acetyl-CoA carboxylase biotin carboxyl carrier protein subunit [Eubacterium sp.]
MKRYTITVNGTPYDVTVDEAGASAPAPAPVAAPAAPAAKPAAPAPAAKPVGSGAEGSIKVEAPMPGTILDVKTSVGASVKSGDVLCILEAMKMENDIVAPADGTVASIAANKGDSVEAGQIIVTLN